MELPVATKKEPLNWVTHSVRASQAVLQYGVGAMVDFPDQTLMTAAPEYWKEQVIQIHDERLERALKVNYFGLPAGKDLSLIHISEPTRPTRASRMPSSA